MKKIIPSLLFFIAFVSCQNNQYTLQGSVDSLTNPGTYVDSLFLMGDSGKIGATIIPENGKFSVSGTLEKPVFADLHMFCRMQEDTYTRLIPVVLEPGTLVLENDTAKNLEMITGSPLNEAITSTMQGFVGKRGEGKEDEANQLLCEHIIAHSNDVSSVFILQMAMAMMPEEKVIELINQCSEEVQQYQCISSVKTRIEKSMNAPKEGMMFTDFEVEYEGKTTRFSDYVGKGQYVLVDFWASWCNPCRAEIPNLIAVYNKYKDKGLVVLGVAAWDQPENTLKAIEEDQIPYPQIINSQSIATDAYGIQGIPQIYLFGPDGKMLKRGLRGEMIEKAVAEIFD